MRFGAFFGLVMLLEAAVRGDLMLVQSVQALGEGQPEAQKMILYISGEKLRLDSGEVSSIIRRDKRQTYSIVHAERGYAVIAHGEASGRVSRDAATEPVRVTKTGKRDKINGFSCDEVEVEQADGTKLDAWISADAEAMKAVESVKGWQQGPYADLLSGMGLRKEGTGGIPGLPIRTTVLDPAGHPTVAVEVKQVDNRAVKADIFEPPPGYREMTTDATLAPAESSELEHKLNELEGAAGKLKQDAKP